MTRPSAIVTGGARGIGLACSQALADAGFDILVADLAERAPDGLAADITARGAKFAYIKCDIANLDGHAALVDAATNAFGRIDWQQLHRLDFELPDLATFPCLGLAYDAGRAGGTAPATLSGANEVAVEAFLAGRLRWQQIGDVCKAVLDRHDVGTPRDVDDVVAADQEARVVAGEAVRTLEDAS